MGRLSSAEGADLINAICASQITCTLEGMEKMGYSILHQDKVSTLPMQICQCTLPSINKPTAQGLKPITTLYMYMHNGSTELCRGCRLN